MIYITGDPHGDLKEFISRVKPDGSEWTADDKLIVGGDFLVLGDEILLWDFGNLQNLMRMFESAIYFIMLDESISLLLSFDF